jgi:AraC-like DNA-binding protein
MNTETEKPRSFRSADLNEAREYISRLLRPHDLLPVAHAAAMPCFAIDDCRISQEIRVARFQYGMPLEIDVGWPEDCYFLLVPLRGRCSLTLADGSLNIGVGDAAVVAPHAYLRSVVEDDYEKLVVRIERSAIEGVLGWERRHDSRLGKIERVDLTTERATALREELDALNDALDPPTPTSSAALFQLDRFSYALHAASEPAGDEHDRAARQRADRLAGRAEAFMRAHREENIDIDEIAAHLHVSRRTLFLAFQLVRSYRPYTYLQRVRLESAREDLRGTRDTTVTAVAERWQFSNLGRFGSMYRRRFGELPSMTQKRNEKQLGRLAPCLDSRKCRLGQDFAVD